MGGPAGRPLLLRTNRQHTVFPGTKNALLSRGLGITVKREGSAFSGILLFRVIKQFVMKTTLRILRALGYANESFCVLTARSVTLARRTA